QHVHVAGGLDRGHVRGEVAVAGLAAGGELLGAGLELRHLLRRVRVGVAGQVGVHLVVGEAVDRVRLPDPAGVHADDVVVLGQRLVPRPTGGVVDGRGTRAAG